MPLTYYHELEISLHEIFNDFDQQLKLYPKHTEEDLNDFMKEVYELLEGWLPQAKKQPYFDLLKKLLVEGK